MAAEAASLRRILSFPPEWTVSVDASSHGVGRGKYHPPPSPKDTPGSAGPPLSPAGPPGVLQDPRGSCRTQRDPAGHPWVLQDPREGPAGPPLGPAGPPRQVQHMQAAHAPVKEAADRVIARLSALEARLEFCEKQFSASSDKNSSMVGNPSVSAAALAQLQHLMDMWQQKMDNGDGRSRPQESLVLLGGLVHC